jgi:sec-independent protein translocase protein TatA
VANVGPLEILVVLVIALIVFGPKRLPELGKSLGDGLKGFKDAMSGEAQPSEPAKDERLSPSGEKPESSDTQTPT